MDDEPAPRAKIARMFWDIETAPNIALVWRTGRKQWIDYENVVRESAIICICWKWEGAKKVHSLTWDNGDDREMVGAFIEESAKADEMVAHNGDRFDIKWFNSQCLKHGFDPPAEAKTVDTLAIARRRFYLNSNRLDYLGKLLTGEGKTPTEFSWWKQILLENDPAALAKMVRYCKQDVRKLEQVYEKIVGYHKPKTHVGVLNGRPKWTCARCGSREVKRNRRAVTAKGTVSHTMLCKECHRYYTISNVAWHAFLDWKAAA